ncbi:DUF2231 domain-containing protein [Micromonospora endolithica]|uniref:DUF2231 domain-containing protein n=1 Tax=Micromonospora endolithica TaxID=230091 RepID=A0A3A9Z532_9ACTN|nr:DUF2231 domain-containing protein [Micromonospora endolithica]RKN43552.1 hypothetical protein D7223_21215 [Micromonospora endolithica]TWJ24148.1 hypothetical protein JD76_04296 [Micromonospora endolithica]
MFEQIMGLPVHVLVVHAVVVFVPLLAVLSIAYVALPRFRSRLDWAVLGAAVVAPVTAWVAVESGERLTDVFTARGLQGPIVDQIFEHSRYGDLLFRYTLPLGIGAIALLAVTSGHPRLPKLPSWLTPALSVVVVALAAASLVYVYLTGHSGAEAVWGNTL